MQGLVQEGRNQAKGRVTDRTQWNKVEVGRETVLVERGAVVRGRIKLDEIPYTLAYEKKVNKEQCGLCRMYFEKNSVNYKVPNHRVMDLQTSWDFKRTGRRYNTASFIYAMTTVCTFCSQLFNKEDEVASTKGLETQLGDGMRRTRKGTARGDEHGGSFTAGDTSATGPTADSDMISTQISRKDVAQGQRVYQSSTVDQLDAGIAVSPAASVPLDPSLPQGDPKLVRGSKTRRELDAWWEVDLGHKQHVHSVKASVCCAIQQVTRVNIILLPAPRGFEDPFLDSVLQKAAIAKEFVFPASSAARFEDISWELPSMTVCCAIRVQLRGIHALHLARLQAFQGNQLIEVTDADLERTANSYASLSPAMMAEGFLSIKKQLGAPKQAENPAKLIKRINKQAMAMSASMPALAKSGSAGGASGVSFDLLGEASTGDANKPASPTKRRTRKSRNPQPQRSHVDVTLLAAQIQEQYQSIEAWKKRAMHSAQFFSREEVFALRDVLFNPILQDMGVAAVPEPEATALVSPQPSTALGGGGEGSFASSSATEDPQAAATVNYGVSDRDILDAALIQHSPRGLFAELLKRMRPMLRWIQSREHAKLLGPLLHCEALMSVSVDPSDTLYKLKNAVAALEKRGLTDFSWSQFLISMHLMCIGKSNYISKWAFPPNPFELDEGDNVFALYDETYSANLRSTSPTSSPGQQHFLQAGSSMPSQQNMLKGSRPSSPSAQSTRSGAGGNGTGLSWNDVVGAGGSKGTRRSRTADPLEESGYKPVFKETEEARLRRVHQSYIQFKIGKLDAKISQELKFPKTLSEAVESAEMRKAHARALERNRPRAVTAAPAASSTASVGSHSVTDSALHSALTSPRDSMRGLHNTMFSDNESTGSGAGSRPGSPALASLSRPGTSGQASMSRVPSRSAHARSSSLMDTTNTSAPRSVSSRGAAATGSSFDAAVMATGTGMTSGLLNMGTCADQSDLHNSSMDDLLKGFDKTCALCVQTFPKKALEMKVLWKHVIALRRSWDPALVPKVIEALDQSITMYNLVNVCAFCAQFFDPEFEGGIAYPQREAKKEAATGVIGAITAEPAPYVRFLDTRHLKSRGPPTLASPMGSPPGSRQQPRRVDETEWRESFATDKSPDDKSVGSEAMTSMGSSERWVRGLTRGSPVPDDYSVLTNESDLSMASFLRTPDVLQSRARARRAIQVTKELERSAGEAAAAKEADRLRREKSVPT